jgi:hypothetical protein
MKTLALLGYSLVVASYVGDLLGPRIMAISIAVLVALIGWLTLAHPVEGARGGVSEAESRLLALRSLRRAGLISARQYQLGQQAVLRRSLRTR